MDLLCLGDNIVDRYVDDAVACPGGNCVNVAVHAVRAGASVAYAGSVGDDADGRWVVGSLAAEGVDVSRVLVRHGRTGYADIHRHNGERHFGEFDRGASQLVAGQAWFGELPEATVVHSSYSSGLEGLLSSLGSRSQVSFDFDTHLDDDYSHALLPHVSHAFFSGSGLTGQEVKRLIEDLLSRGLSSVTVTRGELGAAHGTQCEVLQVEAQRVEPVDTLGAGDAFIGTVLAGMLLGREPRTYLEMAADVAARVCRSLGGFGHPRACSGR